MFSKGMLNSRKLRGPKEVSEGKSWQSQVLGRIYYLKFDSYEDKYFFWIQEPDETKDSNIVEQVNKIINFDEEKAALEASNKPKNQ